MMWRGSVDVQVVWSSLVAKPAEGDYVIHLMDGVMRASGLPDTTTTTTTTTTTADPCATQMPGGSAAVVDGFMDEEATRNDGDLPGQVSAAVSSPLSVVVENSAKEQP